MTAEPAPVTYAFDNDVSEAANQLRHIGETVDPHTLATLDTLGVEPGWHCWDVGAGSGSVARWLAERVGPRGHVLATDIKPHHVPPRDHLEVLRHDVRTDPFPPRRFDLVHARLLLMHLPAREQILGRLTDALKPGGILVISDWETSHLDLVLDSPDEAGTRLFRRFLDICLAGSPAVGIDPRWAAKANGAMRRAGLTGVVTSVHARSWPGGTGACLLHRSNTIQLQPELLAAGFTEDELATLRDVLLDPRFVISSYLMFTTVGRRAGERS
ncbi:class I SAM-dependent methyltransferase [Couchioplanes azureus]|uniref:class I SAM-dependent methyltransferase n=1 Tax=Couchioplanes caeruleus TaxID=56438 RepID=UPI0016705442|nr:class I SAM-dependent methyltransferase [Couchioplanes caeruleus]GGQ50375.1 methyltransferase [Couchioplanes caeruleus subsp. azureus]